MSLLRIDMIWYAKYCISGIDLYNSLWFLSFIQKRTKTSPGSLIVWKPIRLPQYFLAPYIWRAGRSFGNKVQKKSWSPLKSKYKILPWLPCFALFNSLSNCWYSRTNEEKARSKFDAILPTRTGNPDTKNACSLNFIGRVLKKTLDEFRGCHRLPSTGLRRLATLSSCHSPHIISWSILHSLHSALLWVKS